MNIYSHNNEFNQSKYTKWYYNIIENAKSQDRKKLKTSYYEKHHILPISIFPQYSKTKFNLVLLTAREHFIVHCLLVKMTNNRNFFKMKKAITAFKYNHIEKRYINSRLYEVLRKNYIPSDHSRMIASSIHKGLISVKDSNENKFKVKTDDPRYISKELIPVALGIKYKHKSRRSEKTRKNMSKAQKRSGGKFYIITFPNNTEKIIKNLKSFCKDNTLTYSCMIKVLLNKRNHHKGFRIKKH